MTAVKHINHNARLEQATATLIKDQSDYIFSSRFHTEQADCVQSANLILSFDDRHHSISTPKHDGGAGRDRTDDPLLAKQVLSQLSYSPYHVSWWAWEDLNLRPHAYQACALTN